MPPDETSVGLDTYKLYVLPAVLTFLAMGTVAIAAVWPDECTVAEDAIMVRVYMVIKVVPPMEPEAMIEPEAPAAAITVPL